MTDPIYKELSFKLNGLAFEVYKTLGEGLRESVYANAYEELLKRDGLKYQRELYYPITINGKIVGKYYFDFLVEDKIVVEIKVGNFKYYQAYTQLYEYLKLSKCELGLIIRFTMDGAVVKRVVNLY